MTRAFSEGTRATNPRAGKMPQHICAKTNFVTLRGFAVFCRHDAGIFDRISSGFMRSILFISCTATDTLSRSARSQITGVSRLCHSPLRPTRRLGHAISCMSVRRARQKPRAPANRPPFHARCRMSARDKRRLAFQQRQIGAHLNRAFCPEKQPNMRLTGRASRRVNIASPVN